jgi:hypothetical protein
MNIFTLQKHILTCTIELTGKRSSECIDLYAQQLLFVNKLLKELEPLKGVWFSVLVLSISQCFHGYD